MSDLSEAIARAEKRLAKMSEADRFKYHVQILRDELQRGIDAKKVGPHAE